MAEILGLGVTHFPPLAGRDQDMARILQRALADPGLPPSYRQPAGWPEAMREEWGGDEGRGAAARHREFLVTQFRKARRILDEFRPDFVLVWGDDQYENFTEDVIPPFFLYPDIPADRVLYEALSAADYATWRGTALSAMEESGQQEVLNWMCLAGAMAELGRKPTETAWIETHLFNSNKCFAYFLS